MPQSYVCRMRLSLAVRFQFLFFLSGISGLIHESLWARYLGLLLGHAAYGQVLTLVVYMGGIGIGSALAGRWLSRLRNPLRTYAWVEGGIALGGLLFHPLFLLLRDGLLDSGLLAGRSIEVSTVLAVGTGMLATLPWAVLLGMTFPLAAGGLIREAGDAGEGSLARLYFGNSLGAACGAVLASYVLIPTLGTKGSLWVAGFLNLVIALLALWSEHERREASRAALHDATLDVDGHRIERPEAHDKPARKVDLYTVALLVLSLGTGLSSFLYEIGWIRMLALLLGSSAHAFDLMISAFVTGLALGALYIHKRSPRRPLRALILAQAAMAALSVIPLLLHEPLFEASFQVNRILMRTVEAWPFHAVVQYLFSAVTMIPAAFFAGMTLPLGTRLLCARHGQERWTGHVYAWNTLGAILGASLGSLLLMPLLGFFRVVALGAVLDILLAAMLWRLWRRESAEGLEDAVLAETLRESAGSGELLRRERGVDAWRVMAVVLLACVLTAWAWWLVPNDRLLVAGAYRGPRKIAETTKVHRLDGRTATISVHELGSLVSVRTNGKPDASLDRAQPLRARMSDELTQDFAAWVARAYLKKPWNGALIGLGSGMTSHRLLGDPRAKHLDAIEIEHAMWEQAKFFRPFNRRAYEDPRHAMHFLDARIFFGTRTAPYDVIVSEPSNPWVAGVSSLFTVEFYREIRAHLAPDGVFVQWVHTYEFEDEMLLSILAALRTQFPHLRLHFIPTTQDMVIAASGQELSADDANFRNPEDLEELARFRMVPRDISHGTLLWTEATVDRMVGNAVPNSEFLPVVDGRAEKAFYSKKHANLVPRTLGGSWFPQEVIPGEDFQARKQAVLDLRARQVADSGQARYLLDWLQDRSPLDETRFAAAASGWAPVAAPAWTWTLPPWDEAGKGLLANAQRLGSRSPTAALVRFQAFSAFGPADSLDAARRDLLRRWPAHMKPSDMRDLFLASLALGDPASARFVLEKQWSRVDTSLTPIEYRFYAGLLKGRL